MDMILNWIDSPIYDKGDTTSNFFPKIGSVEELKERLQEAIELELATIPVYLSAMGSIKPGTNTHYYDTLKRVLIQEMSHMSQACNLLASLGGRPLIAFSDTALSYPSKLHGGVLPNITATLGACTKDRIKNVFMAVESPEEIADIIQIGDLKGNTCRFEYKFKLQDKTIGQFYHRIAKAFKEFKEQIEPGMPATVGKQFDAAWPELVIVRNVDDAITAISRICEDGEGTNLTKVTDAITIDKSHFHAFMELYAGRKIDKVEVVKSDSKSAEEAK
eukprot:CAMPEP_0202977776 /NCGR_PEP_ID=MMETSP1396-20130829/84450_1 /ASSEMBLY_ACC=CAM_ASM_000872 /TAXON_ID= /ORGANISM="Pseudokeronopsis sp., Strain Brazil" /LENGTH=274 /DNA_ID=CAMNT_0049716587 /DNA_START=2256 /DNA_END=3080 /DNA_ORIENTATION=-